MVKLLIRIVACTGRGVCTPPCKIRGVGYNALKQPRRVSKDPHKRAHPLDFVLTLSAALHKPPW